MKRRITLGLTALMAAVFLFQDKYNSASAAGPDSVSIGYAISMSGPFRSWRRSNPMAEL